MRSRFWLLLGLSLVMVMALAGQVLAQDMTGDFDVVQAAAQAYLSSDKPPTISADALWENLSDGDPDNDPFILSVRSPDHYAIGHVPGAINIPWKEVAKPESLAKLPTDRQIVVYCYTGHTGQIATTALSLLGYDAVNLKFGMMGWTKDDEVLVANRFGPETDQRDYRVEQEAHTSEETYAYPALEVGGTDDFEVVRRAVDNWLTNAEAPIISADAVWENLSDGDSENDPFIVSVRSPDHYALGHVPGAINIPWRSIADPENLAKLPADRQIAVYCYTGHTGQVSATILGTLGYNVSNIKYGMMGWTEDDEVLGTARFGPDVQRDYRLETSAPAAGGAAAEEAAPTELPTSGAANSTSWLIWLAGGFGVLLSGLALRRRLAE